MVGEPVSSFGSYVEARVVGMEKKKDCIRQICCLKLKNTPSYRAPHVLMQSFQIHFHLLSLPVGYFPLISFPHKDRRTTRPKAWLMMI